MILSCNYNQKLSRGASLEFSANIEKKIVRYTVKVSAPGVYTKKDYESFADACTAYERVSAYADGASERVTFVNIGGQLSI